MRRDPLPLPARIAFRAFDFFDSVVGLARNTATSLAAGWRMIMRLREADLAVKEAQRKQQEVLERRARDAWGGGGLR